ncbi:hypothetical protein BO86DRAFT_149453 [Aspergillus japonicus CBS 114.51]|uniref:Uncharacterized protein n=1 Tax=Aspergillus japonicus CBS 114.51 TaxID=1448312 RepID=A0A8T8WUK1_ASPJA|nr:hypothetical protein BO86DRAFT_149453 [Aspergillus japonicus CBS 114.51]RAH79528.1 hypothetical protein BO86DRAFT_149453 [Aspergillus japonicus CBS 114.51]
MVSTGWPACHIRRYTAESRVEGRRALPLRRSGCRIEEHPASHGALLCFALSCSSFLLFVWVALVSRTG